MVAIDPKWSIESDQQGRVPMKNQVEPKMLADRIVILNNGAVEQEGPPLELAEGPANRFVAGFPGQPRMTLLRATAVAAGGGIELRLTADGAAVAMRPKRANLRRPGRAPWRIQSC